MPRNRLEELQAAAKHAPITEEEEMKPLKKSKKKVEAEDNFNAFLENMEEVVSKIDQVDKNAAELRSIQKKILMATHKDENMEKRMEDLMAENKKLASRVRKIIKEEQDWVDAKSQESPRKKMNTQQVS